jgi:hypothetical protein
MAIVVAALGIAFAAFCIWLTVRIVNRRERWAKWTLAAVVGLPVLYVLGLGPACWISSRLQPSGKVVSAIYSPVIATMWQGPYVVQGVLKEYVLFGAPRGFAVDPTGIEFH